MTNPNVPDTDASIDAGTETSADAVPTAKPVKPDTAAFEAHRGLLFSIAYRMLGSASEAEDVGQDGYLRYAVRNPDKLAYLKRELAAAR